MDRIWWNLGERYRGAGFSAFVEGVQGIHAWKGELYRALAAASLDMVRICEHERVSRRREILSECPDARMSPTYLVAEVRESHVAILWRTVERSCRQIELPGDLPTQPLKLARADYSENPWILRGAHAEEKDLIVHHNQQVMCMRDLWSRCSELRLTADAVREWTGRQSQEW